MATFKRYEDIEVWQLARQLARDVYALTRQGDFARDYGLKDQIQRAVVSVGSNIAEGFERAGNKEFANFLWIAKGSAGEVGSQLYTAYDVGYVSDHDFENVLQESKTIGAKIYRLIEAISTSGLPGIRYRPRNLKPEPSNPKPETLNSKPETLNPKPEPSNPKPETLNLKPETSNPKPETRNLKPETLNPKP